MKKKLMVMVKTEDGTIYAKEPIGNDFFGALYELMKSKGYKRPEPKLHDCMLDDDGNLWRIHKDKFGREIRKEMVE